MKKILVLLLVVIGMMSCSDQYYLKQVHKRGLLDSTTTVTSDTLIAYKTDTVYKGITVEQNVTYDTLFCDSNKIVQSTRGTFNAQDGRLIVRGERQSDGSVVLESKCEELRDSVAVLVNTQESLIVNNKKTTKLNSRLESELIKSNKNLGKWKTYFWVLVGFCALLIIIAVVLTVKHILK